MSDKYKNFTMDKDKSIGVFVAILPLNVVLHQSVWISMHGFSQNWTYQNNIFPSSFGTYANRFCEKKYIFENLVWNIARHQPEKLTKFNQHEIWDKQMQGRFCIKSFFSITQRIEIHFEVTFFYLLPLHLSSNFTCCKYTNWSNIL